MPVLAVTLAAAGCVTVAPRSRPVSDQARVLPGVPVETYPLMRCGAGSLSTVLTYLGEPVTLDALDATLPKADGGGVLSLDLVLAARRRGWDARLVEGSPAVVRDAIDDGLPAILMLRVIDLPGRGDYYHYVVADGVDPVRSLVRVQFGDGKARWTTFDKLERAWSPTGHATVLVRPATGPPPDLPARELRYAAALEASGEPGQAAALYRRLLAAGPGTVVVWTDLGNAEAAAGHADAAERAYRRALELDDAAPDPLNNLAWMLLEGGDRLEEAEALARRAVAAGGPDPYLALDTLGRVLAARGDCEGAAAAFRQALDAAPADSASRPAIDLALGLARVDCGDAAAAQQALERAAGAPDEATRQAAAAALARLAPPAGGD